MSQCTAAPAARKPARPRPPRTLSYNPLVGSLHLTVGKESFAYWLDVLPHQFGAGVVAVRLTKLAAYHVEGEPDNYDVVVSPGGKGDGCECRGFLRHRHCKHLDGVRLLVETGKLTCRKPVRCSHRNVSQDQDGGLYCHDCGGEVI